MNPFALQHVKDEVVIWLEALVLGLELYGLPVDFLWPDFEPLTQHRKSLFAGWALDRAIDAAGVVVPGFQALLNGAAGHWRLSH